MKKVLSKTFKTSKFLLLLVAVFMVQRVTVIGHDDKLINENLNKTLDLTAMALKINEINMADKYYPLDTFTGDLTGYAADCPLCTGYLSCTGQYVANGTTSYYDPDYGNVVILASSNNLPCGSIVTFEASYVSSSKVVGIVLDRGVLGNDLDLLVSSQEYARNNIGRHKLTYDVLRFGYER